MRKLVDRDIQEILKETAFRFNLGCQSCIQNRKKLAYFVKQFKALNHFLKTERKVEKKFQKDFKSELKRRIKILKKDSKKEIIEGSWNGLSESILGISFPKREKGVNE